MENQFDIEEVKRTIKFLQELVGGVEEGKSSGRKAPSLGDLQDEVWDDQKLKAQFKISTSTVYRRRKDGTFKFFKIGSLYYYYRSDILPHRDRFLK